jgi:hypothetical protein
MMNLRQLDSYLVKCSEQMSYQNDAMRCRVVGERVMMRLAAGVGMRHSVTAMVRIRLMRLLAPFH